MNLPQDFSLMSTAATPFSADRLRGQWTVLYFYPKDATPGCTTEGQDFAALAQSGAGAKDVAHRPIRETFANLAGQRHAPAVSGSLPHRLANSLPELPEKEQYVSVYVPTTPNPTGGYYIFVRKQDIRPLAMSVDEALKYVISLGMVVPDEHKNGKLAAPIKLPEPSE